MTNLKVFDKVRLTAFGSHPELVEGVLYHKYCCTVFSLNGI